MTGHIPKDYKVANLTPIIQDGQKDTASNYGLTPVVGKILETIWWGLGSEQLEKCNLIRDGQCGLLVWVLTNFGFFQGIAAVGGDGSRLDGVCLRYGFEVANWDANAELLLVPLSCAAEPAGNGFEGGEWWILLARQGGESHSLFEEVKRSAFHFTFCFSKVLKTITWGENETGWAGLSCQPVSPRGRCSREESLTWAFLRI